MFTKIKNFIVSHKWLSAFVLIIILVIVVFVISKKSSGTQVPTVVVQRQTITEVVSATGNVKPLSDVDLSFEKGGRVSSVPISVGDKVYAGEFLASVSNADLVASVEQATAGLKIAEANLKNLKNGSTPEQIAVSQSQVDKARIDETQAKQSLINSIQDAYTKADDSIRNKIDVMFSNPRLVNTQLLFQTNDSQLKSDIEQKRVVLENILISWSISIIGLDNSSDIDQAEKLAISNLDATKNLLEKIALAINGLNPDSTITQATIDVWKVNVSTARSNISQTISSLAASINGYKVAVSTFNIAKNQLAVTKSGATADQISSIEASVEEARANIDNANAQLAKSIIRSPITGVVTNIKAKVGEVIQAGMTAISVISYGNYVVESFIPEADIAKIKIGDLATTTLDAYGSNIYFQTSVIKIDPAETIIDGVSTYKVTLKFLEKDERIRSGMTANLDILTNQKIGVLAVSARSIYSSSDKRLVKILDSSNIANEKEVKIGLRGIDGYIEIISGLKEGDKILASPSI
ncbi:MAG: efflux RND transporter periplasmic adaptor subunit [Minisyncoccia bacterium]